MWNIRYHPEIYNDLKSLPKKVATQVVQAIQHRLQQSDPTCLGKPLQGNLAGCYRLRVRDYRIVYHVIHASKHVFIIAIGIRRDESVYKAAVSRKQNK